MGAEIKTNGAVKTPAGAGAPARITVTGPLIGRAGEAVLGQALENAFLPPGPAEARAEGAAGTPVRTPAAAGAAGDDPQTNLSPGTEDGSNAGGDGHRPPLQETDLPTDAGELAELTERAKGNGVTAEEQHAAETAELERLQAKATAAGKTIEQVAAEEAGTATEGNEGNEGKPKTFTQEQVEGLITKRIGNLKAEIDTLKQQLQEARSQKPEPQAATGLEAITDPAKLAEVKAGTEAQASKVQRLLTLLPVNPNRVEAELRKMAGAELEGVELTPESMADLLYNAKEEFDGKLKAIPQHEQRLQQYAAEAAKAEELVPKVIPWVNDAADPRRVMFDRFASQMAGIKQSPAWKYWLGLAVHGHFQLLQAQQAAKAGASGQGGQAVGKKFIPKVTFKPRTGGGGSPAPAAKPGNARSKALAQLKANPNDERALEGALEAMLNGTN